MSAAAISTSRVPASDGGRGVGRIAFCGLAAAVRRAPAVARAEAMPFQLATLVDRDCRPSGCPRSLSPTAQITNRPPANSSPSCARSRVPATCAPWSCSIPTAGLSWLRWSWGVSAYRAATGVATVVQNAAQALSVGLRLCLHGRQEKGGAARRAARHPPHVRQPGAGRLFRPNRRPASMTTAPSRACRSAIARAWASARMSIRSAEHVSSQSLHFVTPGEMARWRLAARAL